MASIRKAIAEASKHQRLCLGQVHQNQLAHIVKKNGCAHHLSSGHLEYPAVFSPPLHNDNPGRIRRNIYGESPPSQAISSRFLPRIASGSRDSAYFGLQQTLISAFWNASRPECAPSSRSDTAAGNPAG